MEHLRSRVKAAERATRKAKDALDEARDKRSRMSAKLDEYEDRIRTARRGRERDELREKYDSLQNRLVNSREQIHLALDAHDKLSQNYVDLFDRMVDAEDASKSKSRTHYSEKGSEGRGYTSTRAYTTRTNYHYGNSQERQRSSSEEPNDRPRHERMKSFEEFTRHKPEQASSRDPPNRFGHYGNYSTEERAPRSQPRYRHYYPDSSGDEEDFTTGDPRSSDPDYSTRTSDQRDQDHHPGYASSDDHGRCYTTEEHAPRSEQHGEPYGAHQNQRSRDYSPTSGDDHPHRSSHRPTSRDDGSGRHSSRSNPRPQQTRRDENTGGRSHRSEYPHSHDSAPQPIRLPSQQTVDDWWKHANNCFKDYSKIVQFPIPPALSCGKPDCDATSSSRPIRACECTIRASFAMVPNLNIKRERLRWHPDKFMACPANLRESFQKMASEVFIVLDKMHKEQ